MTIVKNDLFDYPNRYIFQLSEGFKFSLDSILLAEFVNISQKEQKILDMCTGNAPIPLILSTKTNNNIIGFEIQNEIYKLAKESVKINGLENQINIINDDISNITNLFPGKYFDIITCNPPYFPIKNNEILNKNDYLTIARHELKIDLDKIFVIVSKHLSDKGSFYLVHRPDRLDEIIITANKYKLYTKEIQFIATKKDTISIVLLRFQKHAKYGIKFKKLINISEMKSYQNIFIREN